MKLTAILLPVVLSACSPSTLRVLEVEPGLWRSNQPVTDADWAQIKALGVSSVVKLNLPTEGSDDGARRLGLVVYELGIQPAGDRNVLDALTNTIKLPDADRLIAAEAVISMGGGVLVHCTHGQDRTGLVIGRHRVLADRWSEPAAYREMLRNGFHPELLGLQRSWVAFAIDVGP